MKSARACTMLVCAGKRGAGKAMGTVCSKRATLYARAGHFTMQCFTAMQKKQRTACWTAGCVKVER
eukprot:1141958-Pelagomonas_calceolata.AAC.3